MKMERSAPIYRENCIDSTNSALAKMKDAPHAAVLLADRQSGGRGRQGRAFLSPEGGVYMSMLLKPRADIGNFSQITSLAAVAVWEVLFEVCSVKTEIKWPNDLLLNGKKLCGILTELHLETEQRLVLGIGINLNTAKDAFTGELEKIACSVFSETGRTYEKEVFIKALIEKLDAYIERWQREGCFFLEKYREFCLCKDRDVLVIKKDSSREARALRINDDLSLKVRYENGETEDLFYGEIRLRI